MKPPNEAGLEAGSKGANGTTAPTVTAQQAAVDEITRLHCEIIETARTTLDKAIRIGELLAGIRAGLKHGEWLPWIGANLPFTDRTARNYIRCFQNHDLLKLETVSDLSDAYRLLADSKEDARVKPDKELPHDESDDFIIEVAYHIFSSQGRPVSLHDILALKNHLANRVKGKAALLRHQKDEVPA